MIWILAFCTVLGCEQHIYPTEVQCLNHAAERPGAVCQPMILIRRP